MVDLTYMCRVCLSLASLPVLLMSRLADHRGTGFSERMDDECDQQLQSPYTIKECLTVAQLVYGDDKIRTMSTSNAARDVIAAINRETQIRIDDAPIYIWGVSYGMYFLFAILMHNSKHCIHCRELLGSSTFLLDFRAGSQLSSAFCFLRLKSSAVWQG